VLVNRSYLGRKSGFQPATPWVKGNATIESSAVSYFESPSRLHRIFADGPSGPAESRGSDVTP
jgi:hypothetical protein